MIRRLRGELSALRLASKDPRTPRLARWLVAGAVAYAVSPIDLIPDFVPVLGQLDDLLILPLAIWLAVRMTPPVVMVECRRGVHERSGTS